MGLCLALAGCGGGNGTGAQEQASSAATDVQATRERAQALVSGPLAADPNAPGTIGNFFIRHSVADLESANTDISLAYLNVGRAGASGQIRAVGGHLFVGAQRIRLYGTSMFSGATMPAKADAVKIAQRLKKEGFNAVRLFGFDKELAVPGTWSITHLTQGVLNPDQTLNAQAMDYFDYFVDQLQRNGIYILFPLHASRKYKETPDCIENCEGLDNFLPVLIQSQKDFAAVVLNHVNPYSGRAYKNDPGVFAVEINNENSLTHRWSNGTLDRYVSEAAFASSYGEALQVRWRNWVQAKYVTPAATAIAWGQTIATFADVRMPLRSASATTPALLFKDWLSFLADVENGYKADMYSYLKTTLGVTALVYGTQAHYNMPFARTGTDINDFHTYFGDLGVYAGFNNPGNNWPVYTVQNKSVLAATDVANAGGYGIFERKDPNKPNIITEYVSRVGNQYMAESEPLMTAYAGFQDIDALIMYNGHGMNLYTNRQQYSGYYNNTVGALTRTASALSFRRGDVTPGVPQILKKTKQTYLDKAFQFKKWSMTNFHFGGNIRAAYTQNVYEQTVATLAEEQIVAGGAAVSGVYTTSNNQIKWKPLDRITLDTPRTKSAIGYFRNIDVDLGSGINVHVGNTMNNYAVLSLTSLNDFQVLPSSRMLLTLAGHYAAPGEYPRAPGSPTYSWGDDAHRIEAVPATVRITTTANLIVTALTATGARGANVPVVRNGAYVEFVTGPVYDTGWYLIEQAPTAGG